MPYKYKTDQQEHNKIYRERNLRKLSEYDKKYRKKHNELLKKYRKEYCLKNKDKINTKYREWVNSNRKRRRESNTKLQIKNLLNWKTHFNKHLTCQVCGKEIIFDSRSIGETVRFDHRYNGSECIKGKPREWLKSHCKTDKNIAIWESCDFGNLCNKCNLHLPTKSREKWILHIMNYTFKTKINEEEFKNFIQSQKGTNGM
jgi:hypothetical protein